MRYDTPMTMNSLRMITVPAAAMVLFGLLLLSGCKNNDVPRTGPAPSGPVDTVASDHGMAPYYYGLIEEYRSVLAEDPHNLAANIGMANALKFKGYDYHFSFGVGEHNDGHGAAELPEALTWLWRDYDPAKASQEFLQEPAEKDQPVWRVVQLNRK